MSEVTDHSLLGQPIHALACVLGEAEADHRLVGPVHELVLRRQIAARERELARRADRSNVEVIDIAGKVSALERQPRT